MSTSGRRQRGSLLITAMLLCAIIGVVLVSHYKLASASLTGATRTFLMGSAVDLAESGIERAMACLYDQSSGTPSATAWAGWTLAGAEATRLFSGFTPAPNAPGVVRVYVNNYTNVSGTPVIVAKSTITPANSTPLDKYVEVTLRNRSLWSNGIVARTSITGDSNLVVDSWNSAATSPVTNYSAAVRRANGSIGVVASGSGALNVGDNATIYGSANTGGGSVSKTGASRLTSVVGGTGWSSALEHRDFAFTFPAITIPTPVTVNAISANVTATISFPRVGDRADADGKYYYAWGASVNSYAAKTMTITAPCVFLMTSHAATTNSIVSSSSATWTYGNATATLDIYTSGSMYFDSGASFFANGTPSRCKIYFTASAGSQFHTAGGGTWSACVYGPNTAFNLDSGGDFRGSVVMQTCQLRGGVNFHYDEALATLGSGAGVAVARWKELQGASERAAYTAKFAF